MARSRDGVAADFRMLCSWRTHPKREKLRRRLGADGVLALEDLWSYCALPGSGRHNGDLAGMTDEDIAIAGAYAGDAAAFVGALADLRLLDGEAGAWRIHDWADHQPWVSNAGARSHDARRKSHQRRRVSGQSHQTTEWCDDQCNIPGRVSGQSPVVPGHVPINPAPVAGNRGPVAGDPGERSVETLDQVQRGHQLEVWGYADLNEIGSHGPEAERRLPIWRHEFDGAMAETKKNGARSWAYFFRCLDTYRKRAAAGGDVPKGSAKKPSSGGPDPSTWTYR